MPSKSKKELAKEQAEHHVYELPKFEELSEEELEVSTINKFEKVFEKYNNVYLEYCKANKNINQLRVGVLKQLRKLNEIYEERFNDEDQPQEESEDSNDESEETTNNDDSEKVKEKSTKKTTTKNAKEKKTTTTTSSSKKPSAKKTPAKKTPAKKPKKTKALKSTESDDD